MWLYWAVYKCSDQKDNSCKLYFFWFYISGTDEFYLSTDFNSRHFLVGALLSEVRAALGEVAEVQRVAVGVLRDLLAKHAFDDRYLQSVSLPLCLRYFCLNNFIDSTCKGVALKCGIIIM